MPLHPVEDALELAQLASERYDIRAFHQQRKSILSYLESQYQGVMSKFVDLAFFITEPKISSSSEAPLHETTQFDNNTQSGNNIKTAIPKYENIIEELIYRSYQDQVKIPTHLDGFELENVLVLLEDFAISLKRDMPLATRLIIQREQQVHGTLSRLLPFEAALNRLGDSLPVVRRMDSQLGYRDESIEYPDRQNFQKLLLETLREAEVIYLNIRSARKGLFKFDLEKDMGLEFTAGEAKFEEKVDWDGYVKALRMYMKRNESHLW